MINLFLSPVIKEKPRDLGTCLVPKPALEALRRTLLRFWNYD